MCRRLGMLVVALCLRGYRFTRLLRFLARLLHTQRHRYALTFTLRDVLLACLLAAEGHEVVRVTAHLRQHAYG